MAIRILNTPMLECPACGCQYTYGSNDVKGKSNLPYIECPVCGVKHWFKERKEK